LTVETTGGFKKIKTKSTEIGNIRTFENFVVPVPEGVDLDKHQTVEVWCESFEAFFTAAKYR